MHKRKLFSAIVAALFLMVCSTALAQTGSVEDGVVVMRPGDERSTVLQIEETLDVTTLSGLNSLVVFTLGAAGNLTIQISPSADGGLENLLINYMLLGFAYSPGAGAQVVNGRAMTPDEISLTIPINSSVGFVFLNVAVINLLRELNSPATFVMTLSLEEPVAAEAL